MGVAEAPHKTGNREHRPSLRQVYLMTVTMATLAVATGMVLLVSVLTLGHAQDFVIYNIGRTLGGFILRAAGVKLKIERSGEPANRPAIYIANHSSTLDLFVILALGLPRIRFVAKQELKYNPFFAVMGMLTGQIFIKRQESEKAIATLNQAYARIRQQRLSLLVMPEGTRRTDGKIGPFKKGAFRMAIDLQYPIVPMYFGGARRLCPGKSLNVTPGTITVHFHSPIDTSSWTPENLDEHVARVRQAYIEWDKEHSRRAQPVR